MKDFLSMEIFEKEGCLGDGINEFSCNSVYLSACLYQTRDILQGCRNSARKRKRQAEETLFDVDVFKGLG